MENNRLIFHESTNFDSGLYQNSFDTHTMQLQLLVKANPCHDKKVSRETFYTYHDSLRFTSIFLLLDVSTYHLQTRLLDS